MIETKAPPLRGRELLLSPPERWFELPNLVTLLRLPLAAVPWLFPGDHRVLLGVVLLGAFTDGLDGFLARLREGALLREPSRRIGVWLDPLCDKIFVAAVLAAAWHAGLCPPWMLPLVLSRELLLTSYLVAEMIVRRGRRGPPPLVRAELIGKIATGAQFVTLLAMVGGHSSAAVLAPVTGILGLLAGLQYIRHSRSG